jgi:hypothetical protein
MNGLMNHCGANLVTLDGLKKLSDPKPMSATHRPIRHDYFVDLAKEKLADAGYDIESENFSLLRRHSTKKKSLRNITIDNLFGMFEVKPTDTGEYNSGELAKLVGFRNSSTMHFRATLGCGNRVFVCDNLCFSANIVVGRKHTEHIKRDLPDLMGKAIDEMRMEFLRSEHRVDIYKETELNTVDMHHIIMTTLNRKHIPSSCISKWVKLYRNPTHEEFRRKDCWGLQNAFTEVAKMWNFPVMQERTSGLTEVMDRLIKLDDRIKERIA